MIKTKDTYKNKNDWTKQKIDRRTFGGVIYEADFDIGMKTQCPRKCSPLSKRIISNWNFDYFCQVNGENMKRSREMRLR